MNMKNENSLFNRLIHPFRYVAGVKALWSGVLILVSMALAGYGSSTLFDGVLDIHYGTLNQSAPLLNHFLCLFVSWIVAVVIFYLTARILSGSSIRLIDFAGTLALAKTPLLIAALLGFIPALHPDLQLTHPLDIASLTTFLQENIVSVLFLLIILMFFVIVSIVWMYNAYSVSGNLKGEKSIVSFIIALIVAEIISKILLIVIF
jgi:hypothetical protein